MERFKKSVLNDAKRQEAIISYDIDEYDAVSYTHLYVQGERTGEGIYYHASGNKYVGSFKDGKQEGHGCLLYTSFFAKYGLFF